MATNKKKKLEVLKSIPFKTSKAKRNKFIQDSSKKTIQVLCECCDNLLKQNIKVDDQSLRQLQKYKHIIRLLANKSDLQEKKRIISQKGGFLQYLIPAAITALTEIIKSATE